MTQFSFNCKECGGELRTYFVYGAPVGCYVCGKCKLVYIDIEGAYKHIKLCEKKSVASTEKVTRNDGKTTEGVKDTTAA